MIYIVGSGPAGSRARIALVSRGIPATLLDAGIDDGAGPPPGADDAERAAAVGLGCRRRGTDQASNRSPATAPYRSKPRTVRCFRIGMRRSACPSKSTASMRASCTREAASATCGAPPCCPTTHATSSDWPVRADELAPHYQGGRATDAHRRAERSARAGVPVVHRRLATLKASRQADALMRDLEANADALERDGWRFGRSRLAVVANAAGSGGDASIAGCVSTGVRAA